MSIVFSKIKVVFISMLSLLKIYAFILCSTSFLPIFLYRIEIVSSPKLFIWFLGITFLVSFLLTIYLHIAPHHYAKSKFKYWLYSNKPYLVLFLIFVFIISISMRKELLWSYEKIKEVVSLEWTIASLFLSVFLVWHTIIPAFLNSKRPAKTEVCSLIQKAISIEKKSSFCDQTNMLFSSVGFLTCTIFSLLVTTSFVFIVCNDATILTQNLTIASFYLCTNAFLTVFLDILIPLKNAKKDLLQDIEATKEELSVFEDIKFQLIKAEHLIKKIDADEEIDEQSKEILKKKIISLFLIQIEPSDGKSTDEDNT